MKYPGIAAIAAALTCLSTAVLSDTTGYELPSITKAQLKAVEEYIQKGNYHAEKKAYRTALNEFSKAAEISSLLFNPRYNKSRMLYQLGEIDKAINELNSLNSDFKDNISGFNFLGQIMVEQGKKTEGKQLFEKAVQNGEAILKKAQIIQAKIDIALAYHNLGSILVEEGDLKSAEENLRKSVKMDDSNYFSYYALGSLMVKTGRFNQAAYELQKARELNKDFISIDIELAKSYLFSNPPNAMRAISALRDAARKDPDNVTIYELLGDSFIIRAKTNLESRQSDYKEAMNSYRSAANLDKDNPRYKVMLASACSLAGEYETALKVIKDIEKDEAALTGKYSKELHLVKAHISREKKELANAAGEYAKAFDLDQKDVAVGLEAGINYYEAKDFENAKKYLTTALAPFTGDLPGDLKPKIEKARKMLLEIEGGQ